MLAKELARRGITVNAVAPGVIHTPMLGGAQAGGAGRVREADSGRPRLAGPRTWPTPCCFFACEESEYITGQTLPITGGWF